MIVFRKIYLLQCLLFMLISIKSTHGLFKINETEHGPLDFASLGQKYGQRVEEHEVVTEDGYILKLFNIPRNKSRTVLFLHGIMDSAYTYIIRGYDSMSVTLAEEGFDVWLANIRGVKESRQHVHLNPDTDDAFWDYSFHEMGHFDLPAIIDYILYKNSIDSLSVIGHSQGNQIFYVLGATRPEYNDKIKILLALAPVCYLNHIESSLKLLIKSGTEIKWLLELLDENEIFSESSEIKSIVENVCYIKYFGYKLCSEIIFSAVGYDVEEFEERMLRTALRYYPASVSRKNAVHLLQIARGKNFSQFDYGEIKNIEIYNSTKPPLYNLTMVTMKVALFIGENDKITPIEDVKRLATELPNVVEMNVLDYKKMNHMDFIWGRHMSEYLFSHVIDMLNKFN